MSIERLPLVTGDRMFVPMNLNLRFVRHRLFAPCLAGARLTEMLSNAREAGPSSHHARGSVWRRIIGNSRVLCKLVYHQLTAKHSPSHRSSRLFAVLMPSL